MNQRYLKILRNGIVFTLMFTLVSGAVLPVSTAIASAPARELVSASHPKTLALAKVIKKTPIKKVVAKKKKKKKKKERLILNPPLIDPSNPPSSPR